MLLWAGRMSTRAARESETPVNHPRATTRFRRRGCNRGVVTVEYAFLLVILALPIIAGITAAGVILLGQYQDAQHQMLLPTP
jgi:Flp pilus assembly pilin Flp